MNKTLIYIIGAGRSGTTLIDIVLGNNFNSLSLGEVNRFFKRNGIPPKRDENSEISNFWKRIKKEIDNDIDSSKYDEINSLFNKNEYHLSILKSLTKQNNKSYVSILNKQYQTLIENTVEDILIESSKYPLRALNISNYTNSLPFEVKYIYVQKDPVKVISSFNKKHVEQPAKGFFASNLYYLAVNLLCLKVVKLLKKRGHKVYQLKYEDFIKNPRDVLEEVSMKLDFNCEESLNKIENEKPLKTGLLFDGNRIRLKETIFLRTNIKKPHKSFKYYFVRTFNYIVYK